MGFSIWHLLVILVIALVIFGTKKLRDVGGDLGAAIKNFKSGMRDDEQAEAADSAESKDQKKTATIEKKPDDRVIEGKVSPRSTTKKKKA